MAGKSFQCNLLNLLLPKEISCSEPLHFADLFQRVDLKQSIIQRSRKKLLSFSNIICLTTRKLLFSIQLQIAKNYRNYLIANQGGLYLREITDVTESKETLTINLTPTQSGTTLKATAIPTKAVDACKPQLARFVSSVSKMVSVSSSLLNNMSSYADYGSKTSFSSSFVERTFSGLNGISVPTCADQPTEIVYSLGLIRDTMFPAYIEMEMGGAMSASRSDVGRWRDEVNGLLNDVKRLMGQIE